ncbi:hypothetical protein CSIM01_09760 [Colletotrichum simmondsii]|uniref:M6 protein n=2 Tax=Colletotrichum acutatum species complex TaxID=2707335 RepID=A0A135RX44_9PEZI|nr:hypothetical protein CSIM01_09760 [Colletotrichum simmondsii]KXH46544.1 hypothetical protein CNYM01_00673 [Colletotrichum nymphaeae SA-01]
MLLKDLCLLSLLMVARVSADKHRLCACISDQGLVGVQINDDATKAVVNAYDGRFVYAGGNWFSDELHGAPYSGPYWHAIEGTVNGAKDDGWVGGDEAHGLCKKQNCDSACFSPGESFNWQGCGPDDECFTSKAKKTDKFGNPV